MFLGEWEKKLTVIIPRAAGILYEYFTSCLTSLNNNIFPLFLNNINTTKYYASKTLLCRGICIHKAVESHEIGEDTAQKWTIVLLKLRSSHDIFIYIKAWYRTYGHCIYLDFPRTKIRSNCILARLFSPFPVLSLIVL